MAMAAMASSLFQMPNRSATIVPRHSQQVPPSLSTRNVCARCNSKLEAEIAQPQVDDTALSRRQAVAASSSGILFAILCPAALADVLDEYKSDTEAVIAKVKETLSLEKTDPAKPNAVASLRQSSNSWVAKYRRQKEVAGKPSFSNMYSVLNAISGHYISFGAASPIPAKRQQRILEEVKDAEKALSRGR